MGGWERGAAKQSWSQTPETNLPSVSLKPVVNRFFLNALRAIRSLSEQGSRIYLSALGVFVAMVAIILLIGIARGVQKDITTQVDDLGVNVLIVLPVRVDPNQMSFNPNLGGQSYLTDDHAEDLRNEEGVLETAKLTFVGGGINFGSNKAFPILIAATPSWFEMHKTTIAEGRLFDDRETEFVCVIGSVAREQLFGKDPALGQEVLINGKPYKVIGVTTDKKQENSLFSMGGFQNVVYLPFDQFRKNQPNSQIDRIMVQTRPDAEPKELVKRLDTVLSRKLNQNQFTVLTQEDLLGLVYKLMSILTWLLVGLTSIALFVGGIGIMAVMVMSVGERTREIGIQKTVGAKRGDIFQQFLVESALIALLGGLAGLAFSALVSQLLSSYTVIKPELSPGLALFGLAICLVVGVGSGLLPATKAARKNPIDALRRD